ncbi:FAD-dependent monooxygenase [Jiangella alba]|uniref:2-polyprenyl-6-methoxyphenol hydroxylase n=1 Tax=Jiangella alba TaxID=561176 RepID=A0A1H5L078_9ACTN|nr:FAD-dependent monooxygenase [Jiangella alba]SEE69731.1 2-polyprenyl-6-methoxyphenol hydroxylase [Jiangella alba]
MTAPGDVLDVLVVGAGPTGLALAATLRSYGARFRVVDRALDRVHESRALAIQPRTLEVLAGLGLSDQLVAHGNRTVRLHLHASRRTVSMPLFDIGLHDTAYPYLLFLSQAETERILTGHLVRHGVRPERGTELVALDQDDDTVTCRLRSAGVEESVTARYVAGCDGARSAVRRLAGIGFDGLAYPQTFVLADLEADGIDPGAAHAFVGGRGILFFFPLATPASWRLLAMRPPGDPASTRDAVTLSELQALVDAATAMPVRLHDPIWTTDFRIANRGATRYRSGRVFLAGDAAHVHSPAGAQGMNTGIQDAVNLGWKLGLVATGRGAPELLETYETERAPVGRRVLRFTDRAFTIATSERPLLRAARARAVPAVAPLAGRFRRVRGYGFRVLAQLAIRYRHSPLSAGRARRRGPRPGDRLPDAPVIRGGRPTTLHAELGAPGFHLVLCGSAGRWPASAGADLAARHPGLLTVHRLSREGDGDVLVDHTGRAGRRLHVGPAAAQLLVRPDGHLAYRGDADLGAARAYLDRWLVEP